MSVSAYSASRRLPAQVIALSLALSIPLSTALDNVLLALLLLASLFAYAPEYWRTLQQHPVARASVVLFAALLLGCAYGISTYAEAFNMLGKYADLAFVPLLLAIFAEEKWRQRAWLVFLSVMVVTSILSWAVGLRLLPVEAWMWGGTKVENPAIFRSSITQNILMGFAAYVLILRAYWAGTIQSRLVYAGLAGLTASSVLFLVPGRSGYLVLLSTLLWFGFTVLRARSGSSTMRRLGAALLLLPLLLWGIYETVPRLHQRVGMTIAEYQVWFPHSGQTTSIGERLEFYYNTAHIVAEHPVLGVGTGGFATAYAQQASEHAVTMTNNPHNEYLHLTVQLGMLGAVLFLYLLYAQWRTSAMLGDARARDTAAGLVLTLAVTSLVNTPLMDHTEGLFFAYMSALCFASLRKEATHG